MEHTPEVHYAIMRLSLEMFDCMQTELNDDQRQQVLQRVNREMAIGQRVLSSTESVGVSVPEPVVEQAVSSLRDRFDSEERFIQALEQNNLDLAGLRKALEYELKVEAALERVLGHQGAVSDDEVEIYYYQHLERFELPETRTARHILITINEEYPENSREQVQLRITQIESELREGKGSFNELAERHSECPTAMHDGLLGRVKQGQLFPELDTKLFSMQEGEISSPVETEVGMHLLLCETVHAAGRIPFDEVREKLKQHLEQRKRKRLLNEWLQQAA